MMIRSICSLQLLLIVGVALVNASDENPPPEANSFLRSVNNFMSRSENDVSVARGAAAGARGRRGAIFDHAGGLGADIQNLRTEKRFADVKAVSDVATGVLVTASDSMDKFKDDDPQVVWSGVCDVLGSASSALMLLGPEMAMAGMALGSIFSLTSLCLEGTAPEKPKPEDILFKKIDSLLRSVHMEDIQEIRSVQMKDIQEMVEGEKNRMKTNSKIMSLLKDEYLNKHLGPGAQLMLANLNILDEGLEVLGRLHSYMMAHALVVDDEDQANRTLSVLSLFCMIDGLRRKELYQLAALYFPQAPFDSSKVDVYDETIDLNSFRGVVGNPEREDESLGRVVMKVIKYEEDNALARLEAFFQALEVHSPIQMKNNAVFYLLNPPNGECSEHKHHIKKYYESLGGKTSFRIFEPYSEVGENIGSLADPIADFFSHIGTK